MYIDARSGETIIPDQAVLGGSVRMEDGELLKEAGELIESVAVSIAAGYA